MGQFANTRRTQAAAVAATVLVLALNLVLILQTCGIPVPGLANGV